MTDLTAFVAFLREEEKRSYDEIIAAERAVALSFYNGELYGDETPGRSSVVTRDVAEVVDPMTVSILRTMISGDRAVEFEHPDKVVAEQVTLAMAQTFFQGQRGYFFLGEWIKAGLLEKTSVAKCCVEPQRPIRHEAQMSADEMTVLGDSGAQIVAADEIEPEVYNVAWLESRPPLFRDYVIPNEQCSFAQDATDLDDDSIYFGLHHWRTLSQLAELGFETEGLASGTNPDANNGVLWLARDGANAAGRFTYNRSGANRKVIHHEEYVRYDLNGDGVSELLLVHRVGDTILTRSETGELAIEEVEEQPGVVWCPFPMPHRIVGQSLADKSMDIQRVSSVLMRQALDNLYLTNSPRWLLSTTAISPDTIEDLLTPRAGGIIRHEGVTPPQPVTVPFAAESAFQALEVVRGDRESRTGITRMNQGLDADTLNKTATGTSLQMAAGQQIEEYISRNFAEAFARLMLKKYRLMRRFGEPFHVIIDGQPQQIDPRQWPEDMQVTVRVGLGTGRRDQRIQHRMELLQIAAEAMARGSRVFTDDNIFNNVKGLISDMSVGSPHELATDPSTLGPTEPKPDAEMAKVQLEAQKAQASLQLDSQKSQAQLDAMREKHVLEMDQKREASALEMQLAREKADQEAQLEMYRINKEAEVATYQAHVQASTQAHIAKNRPGGALDA